MGSPTEQDVWLFGEGRHERLWELLGAHPDEGGTRFTVWAPRARAVSVLTAGNGWSGGADPLAPVGTAGLWSGVVPGAGPGTTYKYEVVGADGQARSKADPMAATSEQGGGWASVVFESQHVWHDAEWMAARPQIDPEAMRLSVYEVHLGSWRRHEDGRALSYRELAPLLADHVATLGFTHVELMPVAEHPYEPSWGYQVTGYYAPTSRYGSPDDFRWFVDHLHDRGIGVIVDWVPAHFPKDDWSLARFDGAPLYEHSDPKRAEHPDWGTYEFDHSRPQVRNFLIANALFWLQELHVDGLRVDAVASMLYLDYSRTAGQWTPNPQGGNEDLDAIGFLQDLNTTVGRVQPGSLVIAEESTAWPGVSRPVHAGGLGFTHKWNMGWMHDSLEYWSRDAIHRRYHHNELTFGLTYAWAEHFVLPLSHDEVVHLKKPLLLKMPGHRYDQLADLRSLLAWMFGHPGKQLVFMGTELAEEREWSQDHPLDWDRLDQPDPAGIAALIAALNVEQSVHPALYAGDGDPSSFAWLSVDEADQSTLAFERWLPGHAEEVVVVIANLSGVPRMPYRVGLVHEGTWDVILTTDDVRFGGHTEEPGSIDSMPEAWQGRSHSADITVPARSVVFLAPRRPA